MPSVQIRVRSTKRASTAKAGVRNKVVDAAGGASDGSSMSEDEPTDTSLPSTLTSGVRALLSTPSSRPRSASDDEDTGLGSAGKRARHGAAGFSPVSSTSTPGPPVTPFATASVASPLDVPRVERLLETLVADISHLRHQVNDLHNRHIGLEARLSSDTPAPMVNVRDRARVAMGLAECTAQDREEYFQQTGLRLDANVLFTEAEAEQAYLSIANAEALSRHKKAIAERNGTGAVDPFVPMTSIRVQDIPHEFLLRDSSGVQLSSVRARALRESLRHTLAAQVRQADKDDKGSTLRRIAADGASAPTSRRKNFYDKYYHGALALAKAESLAAWPALRYGANQYKINIVYAVIWKSAADTERNQRKRAGAKVEESGPSTAEQLLAGVDKRDLPQVSANGPAATSAVAGGTPVSAPLVPGNSVPPGTHQLAAAVATSSQTVADLEDAVVKRLSRRNEKGVGRSQALAHSFGIGSNGNVERPEAHTTSGAYHTHVQGEAAYAHGATVQGTLPHLSAALARESYQPGYSGVMSQSAASSLQSGGGHVTPVQYPNAFPATHLHQLASNASPLPPLPASPHPGIPLPYGSVQTHPMYHAHH